MAPTTAFHSLTDSSVSSHRAHAQLRVDVLLSPEVRITVRGEMDLASADVLTEALADIDPDPRSPVAMDLSKVSFIDLAGLTTILEARTRFEDAGSHIVIESMSIAIHRLLDVLDEVGCPAGLPR